MLGIVASGCCMRRQQLLDVWWCANRGSIPLHPGMKPTKRPGYFASLQTAVRDWRIRCDLFHEYQAELKETRISEQREALYVLTLMVCGFEPQRLTDRAREIGMPDGHWEAWKVWSDEMKRVYETHWHGSYANSNKRWRWKYRYQAWCRLMEKTHE